MRPFRERLARYHAHAPPPSIEPTRPAPRIVRHDGIRRPRRPRRLPQHHVLDRPRRNPVFVHPERRNRIEPRSHVDRARERRRQYRAEPPLMRIEPKRLVPYHPTTPPRAQDILPQAIAILQQLNQPIQGAYSPTYMEPPPEPGNYSPTSAYAPSDDDAYDPADPTGISRPASPTSPQYSPTSPQYSPTSVGMPSDDEEAGNYSPTSAAAGYSPTPYDPADGI